MARLACCRIPGIFLCYIGIALALYLILFSCSTQMTVNGQDNNGAIKCVNGDYRWYGNVTRCHMECPSNCTCTLDDVDTIISNCTDGYVYVTQVLYPPGNVNRLYWDNSTLHSIEPMAFARFGSRLRTLDLSRNALREIQPGVFEGLTRLDRLYLYNNALHEIQPGVFAELTSLEVLDLSNNALHEIPPGVFAELTSLEMLSLFNNALHEIQPGVFAGLTSLERLSLSNNALHEIPPGVFAELTSLEMLSLFNNALHEIQPGVFAGLTSLERLSLSNNALHEIQPGVFAGLTSLEVLYLYNNALHEIQPGVFAGLTSLEMLSLFNNALHEIQPGVFAGLTSLEMLYLSNNALHEIQPGVFAGLTSLEVLSLSNNALREIQPGVFAGLTSLEVLSLHNNTLHEIAPNTFGSLRNLEQLRISYNKLSSLHPDTFQNQTRLTDLHLNHNQLYFLPENIFLSLTHVRYLNLSENKLNQIPMLSNCTSLITVNLKENPLLWIHSEVFSGLNETVKLFVTSNATCCYASSVQCYSDKASSPFLTCARMLTFDFLRIIMWLMSVFGIFGNVSALFTRFKHRLQSNKVQFLLITNLSISDLIMCIYLIILLSVDAYYDDFFPSNSESWRKGALCRFAGALSVLSSEASAFFITLISIDRFLGIKYPFGSRRLGTKLARLIVAMLWLVALSFSVTSYVLSGLNSRLYSVSEVCVGLPISQLKFYNESNVGTTIERNSGYVPILEEVSQNTYKNSEVSMYLSIAMFTGLNLICFLIVGFCYTAIFVTARKTSRASGRSETVKEEKRMAKKMSLLVLTDFFCWVPIGIVSILVQAGAIEVSPTAYAWIATIVLPINSTLNPFLYTLSGYIFDKEKCPCQKRGGHEENIPMRKIAERGN
ncbi:uncharacterized protein [Amphiura filiformis]|uniref:uncharacterized protein n=1 Tax=Amphiura filiformis TaxID=82378 RepID=UPI003B218860